jgi:predicted dehydrogenase
MTALNNDVEVYGEAGRLRLSVHRFDGLEQFPLRAAAGDLGLRIAAIRSTLRALQQGVRSYRRGGEFMQSCRAEWQHFVAAVRQGTPVESTLRDGRAAVAIVLAAVESAQIGRPVRVGDATSVRAPGNDPTTVGR